MVLLFSFFNYCNDNLNAFSSSIPTSFKTFFHAAILIFMKYSQIQNSTMTIIYKTKYKLFSKAYKVTRDLS